MKKLFFVLSVFFLLFNACKEEDASYLEIDTGSSTFNFSTTADEQEFKISSNTSWTISSNAAWCTVSKPSGTGDAVVKISVTENNSYAARNATISVSSNGLDKKPTIEVKQAGTAPEFTVSEPAGFSLEGGKDTLEISGNVTWTVAQDNDSKQWCTLSATSGGKGASKLIITATPNNNPAARKATLTFTADQFSQAIVKEITQLGEDPELSINQTIWNISGAEQIIEVNVTSNLEYTTTVNDTWIEKISSTSPEKKEVITKKISFKIQANTENDKRTGTVSFTSGSESATLTINQTNIAADAAADSLALLAIYTESNKLATWSSSISTNWGTANPLSTWRGVTLDANGRVVRLALGTITSYSGVGVVITDEMDFSALSELKTLSICVSTIGSRIPASIGSLLKLKSLQIKSKETSVSVNATIPDAIFNLTNLTMLDISSYATDKKNYFVAGELSKNIAKLTNLDTLILNGNKLSKIPAEIAALSKLTHLQIQYNIGGLQLPDAICSLTSLKRLIATHGLTGTIPTNIGNLTNLEFLNLSNNNFDHTVPATIPSSIEKLTKLTELHLNNSRLTGAIPTNIGNLKELTVLNLYSNKITVDAQELPGLTGEIPSSIGSLSKLKTLYLSTNSLTGTIPGTIGNLSEITAFALNQNKLSGVGAGFGNLKIALLDLSDNELTSVAETNFQHATSLNLKNNLLTGSSFQSSITAAKLTSIDFTNNKLTFIPEGVLEIATLRDITLSGNILDAALMTGDMSALTALKTISMSNITSLTAVPACLASAPALETVTMTGCRVTDIPNVNFTTIKTLTLNSNEMTSIPANISKFTALTSLSMNSNKLTSVPSAITSLTKLTTFSATSNQITEIPANWSSIEILTLSDNLISSIPAGLSALKTLTLTNNKLTSIPPVLSSMTTLGNLTLSDNQITGTIPVGLKNLVNLTILNLSGNMLTGTIPSIFGTDGIPTGSGKLNSFTVSNNRLTGIDFGTDPDVLAAFKKISYRTVCPQKDASGNTLATCPIVIP